MREDKVQIEGKQKAPDYSFRIGGVRKFFVEAKKPSVNIKEETTPAFQVRRYAYTAKLPLSILTDFEEFAVYDKRIKPNKDDKVSVGRIFYCTYTEYEKHFEFIYNTFSKPAILKGSFDRYIPKSRWGLLHSSIYCKLYCRKYVGCYNYIIRTETAGSREENSLKDTKLELSPEEISKLNLFLKGLNYSFSRKFFYEKTRIRIIKNYGDGVFENVQMPTFVLVISKEIKKDNKVLYIKKTLNSVFIEKNINQSTFENKNYRYIDNPLDILTENSLQLRDIIEISRGLEIGKDF